MRFHTKEPCSSVYPCRNPHAAVRLTGFTEFASVEPTVEESYTNERLDQLGIVAGVCQEIGLASWLDAHQPGKG